MAIGVTIPKIVGIAALKNSIDILFIFYFSRKFEREADHYANTNTPDIEILKERTLLFQKSAPPSEKRPFLLLIHLTKNTKKKLRKR